jgi:hypothetical protein
MTALQREVIDSAHARGQKELAGEVAGVWCDALALLIVSEWPAARRQLLQPQAQSTSVAIQAWMQVGCSCGPTHRPTKDSPILLGL